MEGSISRDISKHLGFTVYYAVNIAIVCVVHSLSFRGKIRDCCWHINNRAQLAYIIYLHRFSYFSDVI